MSVCAKVEAIRKEFEDARPFLAVIGDETRQAILVVLMGADCGTGMRVSDITDRTRLSRPAVSHQLKALKDSGLLQMRSEGTMNFYSIDVAGNRGHLDKIKRLVDSIEALMDEMEATG